VAVVMTMDWDGVTRDQYDALLEIVRWSTEQPQGAKLHVAGFDERGIHVTDVWESQEDFERFLQERLMPGVQQLGVGGQPDVRFLPLGGVYIPALGYDQSDKL
jgi:hypothetical protein